MDDISTHSKANAQEPLELQDEQQQQQTHDDSNEQTSSFTGPSNTNIITPSLQQEQLEQPKLDQELSSKQQTEEQHQQQQTSSEAPQQSGRSPMAAATNARTNATNTNLTKIDSSIHEDLLSSKRWGTTPIRQDTPWELPPSPTQAQPPQQQHQQQQQQQQQQRQQQQQQQQQSIGGSPLAISPGISQSGDSFHGQPMAVNNINLVGGPTSVLAASSRFDQPWRAPISANNKPSLATSASFANHNLMNAAPGAAMQKSLLNSGNGGPNAFGGNGGGVGMQQAGDFARAPGPASSILDSNSMTPKPFGMAQRASTWSSFGAQTGPNDQDSEWPKSTTTSGISTGGNSVQQAPSNAFDLVHEFEPGKSWHGSNLMKSLDDDSPINIGSNAFSSGYAFSSSKSPPGSQYEASGIGTWSPVIKGNRPGSMWDGDGPDGCSDNERFDDGTAIWGRPAQSKVAGLDWDKSGEFGGASNDKSRPPMAGNNQSYHPHQSASSASLLMSSNTSPSSQHNRNHQQQQTMKQPTLSHNFDQVQQQSNTLSGQANQPNRGLGLSSNVPSKHQQQQLNTMVQQIQLAVQAGHLNPQILNQQLSNVTLQLLYQLLQQIRSLQQLQMKFNQPGNHQAAVSVQMTKTKQNILSLQNQIAAQQAMHLKPQAQAHNISTRQPAMPNLAAGGLGGGIGPALPPGISQSGDSFRSGTSVGDFHGQGMVNNFAVDSMSANGLANSLDHMNLGGGSAGVLHSSRFDQPWRAPANKHQPSMASSPFANHNLMNSAPGGMQKSMLNSGNGGSSYIGMQQGGEFARAPGPASSMMDNNMAPKPFGVPNRSTASTWSAFGNPSSNEPEPEWPKTTTSGGISSSNTTQQSNAFDLVPEFEPGKPWRGSMLMRSVEDDPTMTPGSMARSIAPQRKTIWSDEIL